MHLTLERTEVLRYGENPHQRGSRYRMAGTASWWDAMVQHGGNPLSYLNLFDGDAAWRLVHELAADAGAGQAAVAIIKHANPCGAAVAGNLVTAYERALECDVQSAFGGVVAIGGDVTAEVADAIAAGPQADVIIAASYAPEALEKLTGRRKATRLLSGPAPEQAVRQLRSLGASVLVQDVDAFVSPRSEWRAVTRRAPSEDEWRDLVLAWRVCGRTTSNAIAVVTAGQAVGVGAGQQSRVVAAEIAVQKAGERAKGGAGASDAFFPFPDGLLVLADAGVTADRPAGRVREGRGSDRRRRRGRRGDGHDRRAALPPLMSAILLDGEPVAARHQRRGGRAAWPDCAAEGIHVGLGTILVGDDVPSERYVAHEARGLRRPRHVLGRRAPPGHSHAGRGARCHRPLQRRPEDQRVLGPAPAARRTRRDAGPARRRPRQGCRRTAPGEPRDAW